MYKQVSVNNTEWKVFRYGQYGVSSGPYFPVFSPNKGKYRPEKSVPDGSKVILSPLTGCRKRKAWNKTRWKYMPEERRQNFAETDRASSWLETFLDDKSAVLQNRGS